MIYIIMLTLVVIASAAIFLVVAVIGWATGLVKLGRRAGQSGGCGLTTKIARVS